MTDGAVGFATLVAVFGVVVLWKARGTYARYSTISDIDTDRTGFENTGDERTVKGPVDVSEVAIPEKTPPAEADESDSLPALWAWRIRRKVNASGKQNRTRWRTAESGLAVGEFAVGDDWENIRIDGDALTDPDRGPLQGASDPFDAPNCFFGEPEVSVRLGEPDPITKRLEKWGIIGENGLLDNVNFTISIGQSTMTPDRYQATVIRDGDDLLVRGAIEDTANGPILRGTEETPLLIAVGDLDRKRDQLRSKVHKQTAAGVGVVLIALVIAVSGFL